MRVPLTFVDVLKRAAPKLYALCEQIHAAYSADFPVPHRDALPGSGPMLKDYIDNDFLAYHRQQISDIFKYYDLKQRRVPLALPAGGYELLNDIPVAVGNFFHGQSKHFYFSDNLVEQLLNTDTAPLTRLPFVSSLLTFTHPAVSEIALKLMKEKEKLPFISAKDLKVGVICTRFDAEILMTYMAYNDAFGLLTWGIEPLGAIDGNKVTDDPERYPVNLWAESWSADSDPGQQKALTSIVLNSIAYLNSTRADLEELADPRNAFLASLRSASRTKRAMHASKANEMTSHPTVVAGSSVSPIVLSNELRNPDAAGPHTGRTINSRFLVRGHWRRQAHGKGRMDRKIIFIEPFVKGPDIAELVNKPYIVKAPKSGLAVIRMPKTGA